jgi:putative N6-adenine-specific DNA methylase
VWKEIKLEAARSIKSFTQGKIIATDISVVAIKAAQTNAEEARVDHLIDFKVCPFEETEIPEGEGVIFINPEYGERLGEDTDLEKIYSEIGDFFKKKGAGYKGYIFTGNLEAAKRIGLKTKRRIEFYNAKIDCRLLEYELYSGTKVVPKFSEE